MPLAVYGFLAAVLGVIYPDMASRAVTNDAAILLGLSYYIVKEFKEKRITRNLAINSLVIIVTVLLAQNNYNLISATINGPWVYDFSAESKTETRLEKGTGLFIYGIPNNTQDAVIKKEIAKFGEILEFDRKKWVAYARIQPNEAFRTGELEEKLVQKIKPNRYFYVEGVMPLTNGFEFKLYFLENKPVKLDENFLGITILSQRFDSKTNSLTVLTKSKYPSTWQMLAILTEAQVKGLKKQALLARQ
ncbi:hypothetical protein HZB88_03865 [archaeon]|nr:hypothetical protein [archaeon]